MRLFWFLQTILSFAAWHGSCQNPVVEISSGKICGSILKSRNGVDIFSFRGIPYAEPPIFNRRFQPPVPKQPWSGILNAENDGPACPQNSNIPMSEDCLLLNVYTTDFKESRPVMVYLHGGAFEKDSARSDSYGPRYLLDYNVVLVTTNYRLGILGFIAVDGTSEAPGNLGFKDQVEALKWVQRNIKNFGGNPNLVTLFGQSAGSISINGHLISPMSKGLFQRAIMMSGSAATLIPPLNYRNTRIIAEAVGCHLNSKVVDCLRFVSVKRLLNASSGLGEYGIFPMRNWNIVAEKDFGQERFITADPNRLMAKGQFHRVPILAGYVSGEKIDYAYYILKRPDLLKKFNDDRYWTNPITLLYQRDGEQSRNITDQLRFAYINGGNFSKHNFKQLYTLVGDGMVRFLMRKSLNYLRNYSDVYFYSNSYVGQYTLFAAQRTKPFIMDHGDDLQYLFNNNSYAPLFSKTDKENFMVERLNGVWTNFSRYGKPQNHGNNGWLPSNATFEQIFSLYGGQGQMDFEKYIGIWFELFPGSHYD